MLLMKASNTSLKSYLEMNHKSELDLQPNP